MDAISRRQTTEERQCPPMCTESAKVLTNVNVKSNDRSHHCHDFHAVGAGVSAEPEARAIALQPCPFWLQPYQREPHD